MEPKAMSGFFGGKPMIKYFDQIMCRYADAVIFDPYEKEVIVSQQNGNTNFFFSACAF